MLKHNHQCIAKLKHHHMQQATKKFYHLRSHVHLSCILFFVTINKWIFNVQFPRNMFEFGIIWNVSRNSTTWAIQIQVSFTGIENPKNTKFSLTINKRVYLLIFIKWKHFPIQIWFDRFSFDSPCSSLASNFCIRFDVKCIIVSAGQKTGLIGARSFYSSRLCIWKEFVERTTG